MYKADMLDIASKVSILGECYWHFTRVPTDEDRRFLEMNGIRVEDNPHGSKRCFTLTPFALWLMPREPLDDENHPNNLLHVKIQNLRDSGIKVDVECGGSYGYKLVLSDGTNRMTEYRAPTAAQMLEKLDNHEYDVAKTTGLGCSENHHTG